MINNWLNKAKELKDLALYDRFYELENLFDSFNIFNIFLLNFSTEKKCHDASVKVLGNEQSH